MKIFWPQRPPTKGFSIETLARKYREKISNGSYELKSQEECYDISINSGTEGGKKDFDKHASLYNSHWANRDFSEYIDAA